MAVACEINRGSGVDAEILKTEILKLRGKTEKRKAGLRGGIITLCHQASGAPVAMAVHQGAKDDCEMPAARELLESVEPSLGNAVVTAAALHCQKKTARAIGEQGGDYLIALGDNQPKLREHARRQFEAAPPLCPRGPKSTTATSSSGA